MSSEVWTDAMRKRASDRWKAGESASVIGAALGVSRNAVIGIANRNRDLFPARNRTAEQSAADRAKRVNALLADGAGQVSYLAKPTRVVPQGVRYIAWTVEDIAEAARRWKLGQTTTEIGKAVGKSAEAVRNYAGKNRSLFPHRPTRFISPLSREEREERRQNRTAPQPIRRRPAPVECDAPDPAHAVSLIERTLRHCKFPLWGSAPVTEHLYCGATIEPIAPDGGYCGYHHRIMYRPRESGTERVAA